MQSKLLNCVVALAMLVATSTPVDAECWINADGTMSCRANAVQGQPVRNVVRYAAQPIVRAATAPARVVRYGLFGRARYSMAKPTVSSGSSGSYGSYQATQQSYGSSGGAATYEAASNGSSGGTVSYGDGPTDNRSTAAPVTKAAPAASVPLTGAGEDGSLLDTIEKKRAADPDWRPGPNDDPLLHSAFDFWEALNSSLLRKAPSASVPSVGAQSCTVPPAAPTKRYCIVPPASVKATCRVPASGPSVEAVASL